jgi:glycosyltransferase involved in cell wall biosynthesis
MMVKYLRQSQEVQFATLRWHRREPLDSGWRPEFDGQAVIRVGVRPTRTTFAGRSANVVRSVLRANPLGTAAQRTLADLSTEVDVIVALLHPELWRLGTLRWSVAPVVLFAEERVGPEPWEQPAHPLNVALTSLEASRRRAAHPQPRTTVVISENERAWARSSFPNSAIEVVPHFLDVDGWSAPVVPNQRYSDGVLVVNDLGTRRNSDGLAAIIDELDVVDREHSVGRIDVISANPPPHSLFIATGRRLRYLGRVDDPRPYYASARVVLVPSFFVRGAKSTVLQAWATRRPVVTTAPAAASLELPGDSDAALWGTTPRGVAEHLVRAVGDVDLRKRLVDAGWRRLKERHLPQVALRTLDSVLERAARP